MFYLIFRRENKAVHIFTYNRGSIFSPIYKKFLFNQSCKHSSATLNKGNWRFWSSHSRRERERVQCYQTFINYVQSYLLIFRGWDFLCRATSSLLSSTCTQRIRFKTPNQLGCQNNNLKKKKKKKDIGFLVQMFFLRYLVVRLANSGRKVPSERKTYTCKRMFCITDNQWSFCKSLKKMYIIVQN